jgi:hypothetical protein
MANHTHLVVAYNHDTKQFRFDGDGSREWIRRLFTPETNTWSDEELEYISISEEEEQEATDALKALGFEFDGNANGWQER